MMIYVDILQSIAEPSQYYTGPTDDLRRQMAEHNNTGSSGHRAKHMPWRLVSYTTFSDRAKAAAFEQYRKSGSGRAFAAKRLR